jgi:hypothetical protein
VAVDLGEELVVQHPVGDPDGGGVGGVERALVVRQVGVVGRRDPGVEVEHLGGEGRTSSAA